MLCLLCGLLDEAQFAVEAHAPLTGADAMLSNLCGMFGGCFLPVTETRVACSLLFVMCGCASHLARLTVSTDMRVCKRMFHNAFSRHAFSERQSHALICQEIQIEGKTWERPAHPTEHSPTNLLEDPLPHGACVEFLSRIQAKLALVLDSFSKSL